MITSPASMLISVCRCQHSVKMPSRPQNLPSINKNSALFGQTCLKLQRGWDTSQIEVRSLEGPSEVFASETVNFRKGFDHNSPGRTHCLNGPLILFWLQTSYSIAPVMRLAHKVHDGDQRRIHPSYAPRKQQGKRGTFK